MSNLQRVNNASEEYPVRETDLGFYMTYTYLEDEERHCVRQMRSKLMDMMDSATKFIIVSVFLLDCLYSTGDGEIEEDITGLLVETLINKRKKNPDMKIAVILDPMNRSYARRVSPAENQFRENQIDVFYSDLVQGLKPASFGIRHGLGLVDRGIDKLTCNQWGRFWSYCCGHVLSFPCFKWDDHPASVQTLYDALLLKANHRKLMVVDTPDNDMELFVTSANPHNATCFDVNTAVTVKGAPAMYVYNMLRIDMMHCAKLGPVYAHWHYDASDQYKKEFGTECFPPVEIPPLQEKSADVENDGGTILPLVSIVTERKIRDAVIDMLESVSEGDQVRIQMFYLSCPAVIDAILQASKQTSKPIKILLEPCNEPFQKTEDAKENDGTPNHQGARYLLQKSAPNSIEIRWYATHGEENHAKIMCVTNEDATQPKYQLTTGSGNYTGRNLNGVNMESNIVVKGSPKVCRAFNELFDMFWDNPDGRLYTKPYSDLEDRNPSDLKWKMGERPFYWGTF